MFDLLGVSVKRGAGAGMGEGGRGLLFLLIFFLSFFFFFFFFWRPNRRFFAICISSAFECTIYCEGVDGVEASTVDG